MSKKRRANRSKSGFTLTELMISMTVLGFLTAATMTFYTKGLNYANFDEGKQNVNRDLRTFTDELTDVATHANYFRIYSSYTDREIKDDSESGDFLALVYLDTEDNELIQKIVGFYRHVPEEATEGPVLKFEQSFTAGAYPSATTLEDVLPSLFTYGTHDEVIELSKGLANNKLFYNFYSRSIMVRGEIVHDGSTTRKATNTYNFTVSPRG
ncbi:MAG: type II secretion system protein [Verrucomicrobiota bacterium]